MGYAERRKRTLQRRWGAVTACILGLDVLESDLSYVPRQRAGLRVIVSEAELPAELAERIGFLCSRTGLDREALLQRAFEAGLERLATVTDADVAAVVRRYAVLFEE